MSAVVIIGAVWLGLAVVLAVVLSGAIRLADANETRTSRGSNFAVDGDPFAAPLPAAPIFVAGTPGALLLPRTRGSIDGD